MPAFATHYLFAQELLVSLQQAGLLAKTEEQAFFYGAQGPDFLLFHRVLPLLMPGKSAFSVSSVLHRTSPNRLFGAMADYLRGRPGDTVSAAYAYGFLCHYALDSTAHPYVYATQREIIRRRHIRYPGAVVHNRIEFQIDAYMLRRKLGMEDARRFSAAQTLAQKPPDLRQIGEMLHVCVRQAADIEKPAGVYIRAFADMRLAQRALTDVHGWKIPLLSILQLPLYPLLGPCVTTIMRHRRPDRLWDYMNTKKCCWRYPADISIASCASFLELYEQAKTYAVRLAGEFDALVRHGDRGFYDTTRDRSFLTGVAPV